MPNPLRLAVIANHHFDDVRLPKIPHRLQKLGLVLGAPTGRLLGYAPTFETGRSILNTVNEALSASWLSTKWGVDTVKINAMRRAGELVAVRPAGSIDWLYPAWQFGPDGVVRPEVERALALARQRGLRSEQVAALLERRSGITGGERLRDDLVAGRVDHVLAAILAA